MCLSTDKGKAFQHSSPMGVARLLCFVKHVEMTPSVLVKINKRIRQGHRRPSRCVLHSPEVRS